MGWLIAALVWLLVIGWCTLRAAPEQLLDVAKLPWYCVVCGDNGMADVILNILLFLPLGVILRGLGWSLWEALFAVVAISTSIEIIQGSLLVGRDACVGDVLSDTLGGGLGWFAFFGIRAVARPGAIFARNATIALMLIMPGIWFATGAGLQPSLTDDTPWIGQPMSAGRGKQPFPGTLQRATMNGIFIPNEEMPQKPVWRDSIAFEVNATRATDERFSGAIVMLRIVDTAHVVQTGIDQIGDDARLRLRLRSADWLLHNPRWRVSHAMRMAPGQPWRFRWTWRRDRFTIVNEPIAGPSNPAIEVPLSIGLGWAFVHPFVSIISGSRLLWTALWLAWWFGVLGWFAGRAGGRRGFVVGAAAIACFIGASVWWGFALQWPEVAVAIVGYGTAAAVAVRLGPKPA